MTFIETYSGIPFEPFTPKAEDIHIGDIAHALSQQCRFSGHTRTFYSVAEHCVRVSQLLDYWNQNPSVILRGLLHDASEAYLVDIPTPLKRTPAFAAYRAAEKNLMATICQTFELPVAEPVIVGVADAVLLATEARDLMPFLPEHWDSLKEDPLVERIVPWSAAEAKLVFLLRFSAFYGRVR